MLNKQKIDSPQVSLDNCKFEQKENVSVSTPTISNHPQQNQSQSIDNPLANNYVPKRKTTTKGLVSSQPGDGPLGKFINMLANLIKRLEQMFLDKLEALPPAIKLNTPDPKKKKKKSVWNFDQDLKD